MITDADCKSRNLRKMERDWAGKTGAGVKQGK